MLFVTIWWFVSAHKWFKGPKVNVAHMMLGQGEVVDGKNMTIDEGDSASGNGPTGDTKVLKD